MDYTAVHCLQSRWLASSWPNGPTVGAHRTIQVYPGKKHRLLEHGTRIVLGTQGMTVAYYLVSIPDTSPSRANNSSPTHNHPHVR